MSLPGFHVKPLPMMILHLAWVLEGLYCQIGPKAHRLYNADPEINLIYFPKFTDSYLQEIYSKFRS